MTTLRKRIIDHIARAEQYVLIVIILFLALLSWQEGFIEAAVVFGASGIGLILLSILLHICKITGSIGRFTFVCSISVIALGVYSLAIGGIYEGIFYVLIGIIILPMEVLNGKWGVICGAVVLVLAVGALILGKINDDKPDAIESEVGVQIE